MTNFIIILIALAVFEFILLFIPAACDREIYADPKTGLIWVSKNRMWNWIVTAFIPYYAIAYDRLCDHLNSQGLGIITILIFIFTFPLTLSLLTIGTICALIKLGWAWFLYTFRREEDE